MTVRAQLFVNGVATNLAGCLTQARFIVHLVHTPVAYIHIYIRTCMRCSISYVRTCWFQQEAHHFTLGNLIKETPKPDQREIRTPEIYSQ